MSRLAQIGGDSVDWCFENWHVIILVLFIMSLVNRCDDALDQKKIDKIKEERFEARQEAKDFKKLVADYRLKQKANDKLEKDLKKQIVDKNKEIEQNKKDIVRLEKEKEDARFDIFKLDTEDELVKEFKQKFPTMADATGFGLTMFVDPNNQTEIPYMVFPAWASSLFLAQNDELETSNKQLAEYKDNEQKYGNVIQLKDRVEEVVRQNYDLEKKIATAGIEAQSKCDARNEKLNDALLKEMGKSRFEVPGGATALTCAAAAAGAFFLGTAVDIKF